MFVSYEEKGIGLQDYILSNGYFMINEAGEFPDEQTDAINAVIERYTLEEAIRFKQSKVLKYAKQLRDRVIANVSTGEMASWPIKLAESRAFAAGSTDTPLLTAEATARQITVAQLVQRVNGNAARFAALEAMIGGTDGFHRDNISRLTTFAEIDSYDFSTGWPDV